MTYTFNHLDQPIGASLAGWTAPPSPPREPMDGRHCRLEVLDPERHASLLFTAFAEDREGKNWTYLPYGPFATSESYRTWLEAYCLGDDPLFFAICRKPHGTPQGVASYLRITPTSGSIEVGHILYAPALQRTPAATEAMYLMMKRAFDLGYRRYEWKCDALNAASRTAAQRFGFSFEGIFRQATVYKGRNRDTAWYAVIDTEWPKLKQAFETWLDPTNFDIDGKQRTRLTDLTRPILNCGVANAIGRDFDCTATNE
jgi:RimJ/RimL family protein N-acetyltransferase